jgi:hypothetical protein
MRNGVTSESGRSYSLLSRRSSDFVPKTLNASPCLPSVDCRDMRGIMDGLVTQARKASPDPRDCRKTIDTLQALGFDENAFRRLHHQNGPVARFYSYSKARQRFEEDGNNHRVHQRLMYVLLSCPDGYPPRGKSFQSLAEEAYEQIPPNP